MRCSGLGLRCCADEIALYVALLHAAGGWACISPTDEIGWYVALLCAPLCGTKRAAPWWPVVSLALLNIAAAHADIMSCCNGCCAAAALLLR